MREIDTPTYIQLKGYVYQEIAEAQANREVQELIDLLQADIILGMRRA